MSVSLKDLCVPAGGMPPDLCITLPGGFEVCAVPGELPPSLFAYARLALAAANSAMAPLGPIFTVIEVITAIQKCLATIPGILGPPPNPQKLIEALGGLAAVMEKLLLLIPQLSVPLMVLQLVDVILAIIDGAIAELAALVRFAKQITESEFAATTAPDLLDMIVCARGSLSSQLTNIERAFASINPVLQLINTLGGLAGLRPIPPFEGGFGTHPEDAIAALQSVADTLRVFRSAIPV